MSRFAAALLLAAACAPMASAHPGHGLHIHPEEIRSAVLWAVGLFSTISLAAWVKVLRSEASARKSRRRD